MSIDRDICFDVFRKALGKDSGISDRRIHELFDEVERRADMRSAAESLSSLQERLLQAVEDTARQVRIEALIRQRDAAMNVVRRQELHDRIAKFKSPVEGLKAVLVGIQKGVEGARQSVDAAYMALARQFQGGLIADLRQLGLLEVVNSKKLDREIARELYQIRPDGTPGITGSKEAREIASIFHKWQTVQVQRLNRAGAYIKELKGYIVRQSHDPTRIAKAGFEVWRDFTLGKLDFDRMKLKTGEDIREVMDQIYWDLAKGHNLKAPDDSLVRPMGIDTARKVSEHRQLHFKDADAWFDYNERFGNKSMGEAAFSAADHAARNIALMDALGPEPEAMFKTVVADVLESTRETKVIKQLTGGSAGQYLQHYFDEVSGKTNILATNTIAKVGRGIRAWNSLSKLGMVVISSVTDVAYKAADLRYKGVGFLEAYGTVLGDVVKGRGVGWKREFADSLGAGIEGVLGDIHGRFTTSDDLPGGMTKTMNLFFKMNGLSWWTDTHKTGIVLTYSHYLARQKNLAFDKLGGDLRRSLGLYGIDARKWDALRTLVKTAEDGREYLSPEGIQGLSPKDVLEAFGLTRASSREVARLKDKLEISLRSFFVDGADYAIPTPGAAERVYSNFGTQAGTTLGEAVRMIMQFKQFPLTAASKGLGRALYGRGADTLGQALLRGKGDMAGLAHLMVSTTALGYLAMAAKDILKGKTPRDPKNPKTFAAAFVQGGGAGMYGDFLFGELSRMGTSAVVSLFGPGVGQIESVVNLWNQVKEGDGRAAPLIRLIINNTPLINLFYTRPALDYLFLYSLQEAMSPGYLRRMERRMLKEQNQTFLFPPRKYAVGVR